MLISYFRQIIHTKKEKNKGPRIEPCGTPCLTISHPEGVQLSVFLLSINTSWYPRPQHIVTWIQTSGSLSTTTHRTSRNKVTIKTLNFCVSSRCYIVITCACSDTHQQTLTKCRTGGTGIPISHSMWSTYRDYTPRLSSEGWNTTPCCGMQSYTRNSLEQQFP